MKNNLNTSTSDVTIKDTKNKKVTLAENTNFNLPKQIDHVGLISALIEQIEEVNLRELAGITDEDEKLTQKAIIVSTVAELIRLAQQNNWNICKKNDSIYVFNGVFWKLVEKDRFKDFLGRAVESMGVRHIDAQYFDFRDRLYKQFSSAGILPQLETCENKTLINLKNGTFEINTFTQKLRPFDSRDFLTYQLPFEYDGTATAPIFQKYLHRVLPDPELQLILAEYIAYIFTELKLEKVLLLFGKGANGKSVFYYVINALIGPENVSNYSLKSLAHEYYRAQIANTLLNYGSEITSGIESDLFKQLASGETIEARLPYGVPFNISKYAKLCFNCNTLPKNVEYTEAFFRRFLIIPFEITIPEEDRDPELGSKIIQNELSGVFLWVLRGLERILKNRKFSKSTSVTNMLKQYREESDTVSLFLKEENFIADVKGNYTLKELFHLYRTYCVEDGYKQCSKKTFRGRLEDLHITIHRTATGNMIHVIKSTENVF